MIYFTRTVDGAIVLYAFLGVTGSRQAFSYLYLTSFVPDTHISFVSMWSSGSMALSILVTDLFFYFWPHWEYYILMTSCLGLVLAGFGACLLVESPIQLLIRNDQ